jgi:uncharacterized protein YbjT (DUF2867 family)
MNAKMILLAGATSAPGRRVADVLLAKQRAVRVLVRSDAAAKQFGELGAEVVQGDIRDAERVRAACAGVDTVVSMIGRHFAASREGLWAIDATGNERLVEAAKQAGARRFVLLSALFADRDYAPVLLAAKRAAERALVGSELEYAIVRPSTFTIGASSLVGYAGPTIERWGLACIPATKPISFVAAVDVADALVAAALDTHPARVVDLGGPEALTMSEGALRVAAALEMRARVVRLPRFAISVARSRVKRRFGLYELLLFTEMLCDHGYACDPGPARELLGREPTSVDASLAEYYATTDRTPWSESNFGALQNRSR